MKAEDLFNVIVGADMVTNSKPSPESILKACEIMSISPGETIYVGDQPTDVSAGLNAGVKYVIGIGTEAEGSNYNVPSVAYLK
jgi:HAD superfamily hydrolase (TIGR01509 family)